MNVEAQIGNNEVLSLSLPGIFLRVCETFIELPIIEADTATEIKDGWLCGYVWVGTDWTVSVKIVLPYEFAAKIACKVIGEEVVNQDQIFDVIKELTNMVAGNLKSSLPGQYALSTPGCFPVNSFDTAVGEFEVISSNWFECGSSPILLLLSGFESSYE